MLPHRKMYSIKNIPRDSAHIILIKQTYTYAANCHSDITNIKLRLHDTREKFVTLNSN